jgi:phosphoribosylformimino-5-aminoimidazole carboxamide ribotide isomerase
LDARDGLVATDGWDKTSTQSALELATAAASLPIAGVVYTDIERDGMMTGLNVAATVELAERAGVRVVASGGVTTVADLEALKTGFQACEDLLIGAITGRAIYEGRLDLAAGQRLLDA